MSKKFVLALTQDHSLEENIKEYFKNKFALHIYSGRTVDAILAILNNVNVDAIFIDATTNQDDFEIVAQENAKKKISVPLFLLNAKDFSYRSNGVIHLDLPDVN